MSIKLQSKDGEVFEVEKKVAKMSTIIAFMMEDVEDGIIPIPVAAAPTLSKALEYCKHHVSEPKPEPDPKDWDAKFMRQFDGNFPELVEFMKLASYLDIKGMLDLAASKAADFIKDKSVEEVRELFGSENDYTAEEEKALRAEFPWAF
ncbi:PREDICTED: SKP1-like protein 14 [Tarenaya hassleriana]|uniref:SKP1-like protein 14 n=1 Tax=Tarenaya hassleriana TaxID=28532 RepID=UPI00053C676E|nr:PREDICTED: SKP1-like protein 14 [Tarenaya hassleriana]